MADYTIPLSVPNICGNEWKYVKECLDTEWVSSAGKYVNKLEQNISKYTGSKYAIACINGTSALQVSLRLAGVSSGDEVIVPTLTFIAPINAVAYNEAKPIFMDADNYYNLDVEKTIEFLKNETIFKNGYTYNKSTNNKISAIIPVHIWGNAVWLNDLIPLCDERNIAVVEDASESLGTIYSSGNFKGRHAGTIGNLGCLSFNGNKIITTGGGGMVLTDNENIALRARYLTTQAKDDPVRYVHQNIGYNFRMNNIQAAVGVAQLEQLSVFLNRKREIFNHYQEFLNNTDGLDIANVPEYANNNHWINLLQINRQVYNEDREVLMKRLEENGIQSRPVWKLNHEQKSYKDCQYYKIEKAKNLVKNSLCLPSSSNLSNKNLNKIVSVLNG